VGKDFLDFLFPDEDMDGGAAPPGSGRDDGSGVLRRSTFTSLVQALLRDATGDSVGALGARGELEGWMPREAPPAGPGGRVWAHLEIKTVGANGQLLVHLQDRTTSALELHKAKRGMATAEASALAKSRFLANMSHELRTPMNAINACSLLLSEEHLTVAQAELVQMIGMSCTQMLDLLNQVLDFSKLDSKRMESVKRVFEPFNGRQCVEKVLESLVILANRKGIELGYVLEDGVPDAWYGDEIQFRQVLVNLASNAVKFTERGHVCICVKWLGGGGGGSGASGGSAHGEDEEWLEVQVKDTGKGVPPEALEVIFHPFEQVDSSLTRDISGTGLGLSISKMIMEGLGGQIKAESAVGRGSTFTCTFPFRAAAQKRKGDSADPSLAEWGEALLIMESPVMAGTVGSILTRMGLRYRSVIPNQVSQLLAEEGSATRFGLVILDHQPREISRAWIDCARVVIPWAKAAALARGSNGAGGQLPVLLLKLHRYAGTNQILRNVQAATKELVRPCSSEPAPIFTVPSDVSVASLALRHNQVHESPLLQTWMDLWRGLPCFKVFKPITLSKMDNILQQMQMPSQKRNRLSAEAGGQESPPTAAAGTHGAAELRSRGGSRLNRDPEKVRILVCEDNMVNQRVLTKILQSLGYSDVTLANNGAEGLKAVQESRFNLVLMDIHMPVMDGLQACKEITHPSTPCVGGAHPPVVALTADVVSDIRERCDEVGMVGYLKKPINRDELAETITRHSRKD
jgi:signal transduction histidine kinase/CheY-like chemotaxis protein